MSRSSTLPQLRIQRQLPPKLQPRPEEVLRSPQRSQKVKQISHRQATCQINPGHNRHHYFLSKRHIQLPPFKIKMCPQVSPPLQHQLRLLHSSTLNLSRPRCNLPKITCKLIKINSRTPSKCLINPPQNHSSSFPNIPVVIDKLTLIITSTTSIKRVSYILIEFRIRIRCNRISHIILEHRGDILTTYLR